MTKLANTGAGHYSRTVTCTQSDTGEEITYRIVGDDEADIKGWV